MLAFLLGMVTAVADDSLTLQRIHELAWQRADALLVAGQVPGANAATRAEAAWALGRLGTPEAVVVLEDLRSDPDLDVQVAVAEALGWLEGGEVVLRSWLDELGAPGLDRLDPGVERYAALVRAVGSRGTEADVPRLVVALRQPWPVASIAARGLASMAARGVEFDSSVSSALVSRLRGPDPRVVADVASVLAVAGLPEGTSPSDVAVVRGRIRRGATPSVQARLLRAVWPHLTASERSDLFLTSVTDTARGLRVSALAVLQPGDLPADVLSTFLVDRDPWVRHAAVTALSRDSSGEATAALRRYAEEAPPPDAALAIRALGIRDHERASDVAVPPLVRAALVALESDTRKLEGWAIGDPDPRVRSAAAVRIGSGGSVSAWGRLLQSEDPVVRWLAVRGLVDRRAFGVVGRHASGETDHRVLTEVVRALGSVRGGGLTGRQLKTVLVRAASSPSPALRSAAADLAAVAGADWPDARPVTMPDVVAARRIRGALVETSRGPVRLVLEPDLAPLAVARWAELAESGFYDGLPVWSATPMGRVETGCPRGDGLGDAGVVLPTEVSATAFGRGTVAMTAHSLGGIGSQWFVTTGDSARSQLPHTRIGRVVQGQHVVDRLEVGDTIDSVTIERLPR